MKKGLILLTALLACWNLVLTVELWQVKKEKSQEPPTQDPQQSTRPVSVVTSDITKIVERSEAKVTGVSVLDETGEDLIASGSGTIYSTTAEAVYIITNQHVITSGGPIHVSFANGEQLPAELVGADPYTELSLLKVIPDFRAEAFDQGDSSLCKKGEWVMAIGHSMGAEADGSVTVGVISSKDRTISMDVDKDGTDDWDMLVLQTDAAINAGNSGGPLINMNGELIGITTMKLQGNSTEGISFAIPINEVTTIVEQLKASGKVNRPFVGISGKDVSALTSYQKSYMGISLDQTEGLLVTKIAEECPAEKAGVHVNDILIRFDGSPVDSYKTFRKLLYGKTIGDPAELVVLRNNQEVKLSVTIE